MTTSKASISYVDTAVSNSTGSFATRVSNIESSATSFNSSIGNINNSLTNVGVWSGINASIATKAAITYVDTAVSNSTASFATRITNIETVNTNQASSLTNVGVWSGINNSLTSIVSLTTTKASISYVDSAVSASTGSLATRTSALETSATSVNTSIGNINNSLTNVGVWSGINASIATKAAITYVDTAVSNSTGSFATRISNIETVNTNQASSLTNVGVWSGINASIATKAAITYVDTAVSNSTSSLASSVQTLTSNYNGLSATIQTQQSTINGLTATYSVTVNSNGAISGYRLNSNGTTSSFIVQANEFKIYTSTGAAAPFSVSGNTVTMSNVNITGGVSASAIQAGTISVGVKIQSSDGKFVIDFANKYIQISV